MNRKIARCSAIAFSILILIGSLFVVRTTSAEIDSESYVPIKWAVIALGGFDYYRNLANNAIQRVEKIMQGRGVPYDVFEDKDIIAPTDNPPAGKYALQYGDCKIRYQAMILFFDYEPTSYLGVNQNYLYWAVSNGTNAVIFNKAAMVVPQLLGLAPTDVSWLWQGAITSYEVCRTFNDGVKEYTLGSTLTLGVSLNFHTIIQKSVDVTVWSNKTWSSTWTLGMVNTTYGSGNVWFLGYSLNEYAIEYSASRYQTSWSEWRMDFWGHMINFALESALRVEVEILPYKKWKGAWVVRIDTDCPYWKEDFLPPESVLQTGWIYDYQYCVLGYGRTQGTADLVLASGAPIGYVGIPSTKVMHTSITGVLQTNFQSEECVAIIYNSTIGGVFDSIRLDFNANYDFADDTEYHMWENITYPTVQGKLYWSKMTPNFSDPTRINVAWWQTPMLMENENVTLPKLKEYGTDYGLAYSFHGWQHTALEPSGSSYPMWNGTQFLLNTTYIEEQFNAGQYWMKEKFEGTGHGFEEEQVIISHPFNNHPLEVDEVIDGLPWVLFQYDGANAYIGFGQKTSTSKFTLVSANEEYFHEYPRFAVLEDMIKTLYPIISTFSHGLRYNSSFSFPPYSNSITPANPRDAFHFWLNAKNMLQNTSKALYQSGKITIESNANSALKDYVWKFPVRLDGQEFSGFFDNCSTGQINYIDDNYVYVEFSEGQGSQKLEVTYENPTSYINVTVFDVSPRNSGITNPISGVYILPANAFFSISAISLSGFNFDHWELDGVNVGSANPYSFNVSTYSHSVGAFFTKREGTGEPGSGGSMSFCMPQNR